MKKIICVLVFIVMTCAFVGCASLSDSVDDGYTNDVKPETDSFIERIEESLLGSYEDILSEYSQKLRDATPVLIEEYNEEAKGNQDGLIGLATLCNEKVGELAKISNEGVQEMAQLYLKQGSGSYEEYSEWAGKLQEVYTEEATKIQEAYMNSAR